MITYVVLYYNTSGATSYEYNSFSKLENAERFIQSMKEKCPWLRNFHLCELGKELKYVP